MRTEHALTVTVTQMLPDSGEEHWTETFSSHESCMAFLRQHPPYSELALVQVSDDDVSDDDPGMPVILYVYQYHPDEVTMHGCYPMDTELLKRLQQANAHVPVIMSWLNCIMMLPLQEVMAIKEGSHGSDEGSS